MYMQGTIEVGAFDAKTHFSELLRKIEKGIRVTVTKNGRPVATLTKATDDTTRARDAISAIVLQNGQLFVPNIFFYEMGNILHTAAHKRITKTEQHEIEYDLFELPIVFDENCDTALMMRIQEFADAYSLSFYNAAYLELSGRLQLPLLTFDSVLENAVHIESVQKYTSRKT